MHLDKLKAAGQRAGPGRGYFCGLLTWGATLSSTSSTCERPAHCMSDDSALLRTRPVGCSKQLSGHTQGWTREQARLYGVVLAGSLLRDSPVAECKISSADAS